MRALGRLGPEAKGLKALLAGGACAVAAVLLLVDGGAQETWLSSKSQVLLTGRGQARLQSLAYTFTPEENPLEDFDSDFKAKAYSYEPEKNPFEDFEGYGFSSQSHAKGESPYPPTKEEDTHNVWADLPEKYPFDERKSGLKEEFHKWSHYDWKEDPTKALKEVNVYDDGTPAMKDSTWQIGDKMSFDWHHWKDDTLDQDSTTKALKEINSWDDEKIYPTSGYKWSATPKSVVDDPNDPQDGTESNVLMNYKFPDY